MEQHEATHQTIAVEEHFVTERYRKEVANLAVGSGEEPEQAFMANFPKDPVMRRRMADAETHLAEMDKTGTDVAVLSLNPPGVQIYADAERAVALARTMNDALVDRIRAHPDRFCGLGCLAPQDPKAAAAEVKRVMGPLGLGGVLIASHTHGRYLDEAECEPILAALEEVDATLYLHPRCPSPQMIGPYTKYGMIGALWAFQADAGTHAMRLILSGTLDRHPKLRIVLGHLGEALPFWPWRLDNIYARTMHWAGKSLGMVKLQLKPSEYIQRNFYVTTSGMSDPKVLSYCVDRLGAERILFAIDYPYEDSLTAAAFLRSAPISDDQRALIAHKNAERLFRIKSSAQAASRDPIRASGNGPITR
jgi:5-carboxyvanillate decarboxylase